MFGTLRVFLALTVALSHTGVTLYGYNPGVAAVVAFYILAGMVSYKLIALRYLNCPLCYYKDRVRRIFPLYLLVLVFSFVIYTLGASSSFLSKVPGWFDFFSNITVVPLAYYMYNQTDTFTLIPPVWSLGVELQFYALVPFLLPYLQRSLIVLLASLLVYTLASTGNLHTDHFGYRILAGVVFIFLSGMLVYKAKRQDKTAKKVLIAIYIYLWFLFLYLCATGYKAPYNYETLAALLVFIPIIYVLADKKMQRYDKIDKYLGALSYAVFLVHFPIIWLVSLLGYKDQSGGYYLLLLVLIVLLSLIFTKLEKLINI